MRCVRARLQHLLDAVSLALPQSQQLVFIEEPALVDLMQPGFPIAPDTAIDLVPLAAKKRQIDTVLSNSFGFGGTNASLIMRRAS